MKVLSRSFSLKEKILLLLLSLILVGLAYYQFVDQPVRSALATAGLDRDKSAYLSALPRMEFEDGKLTKLELMPIALASGSTRGGAGWPRPVDEGEREAVFNTFSTLSAPYGTEMERNGNRICVEI